MDNSNEKTSLSISNYIQSSHNTIKSISLNNLNNNSYNLNDGIIITNNNENSSFDKNLNEKIIKLLIGDHPLLPMKAIEKIAYCNFMNQHFKNRDFYNKNIIDEIIHNQSSHIVAEFKDYLIKGDISEFLQQYYNRKESLDVLPKIYEYYISCSVIFPNYIILPERKYIYKNIKKKQRVIDLQQEQEDKEENIKKGLFEQEKEPTIFTTQALDSILNQTDTSGVKQYFGMTHEINKGAEDSEMLKLVNNIQKVEKKVNKNSKKKNKFNVYKLKKGNNNELLMNQNDILLNEEGNNKNIQSELQKKNGGTTARRKNSSNNKDSNQNKNHNKITIKKILRQYIENNNNNNFYKHNNFSTLITYMDSYNNHIKNVFDLKGIESIKKLNKNGKKLNKNKERNIVRQLYKNNSQTFQSLKNLNSKFRNSYNQNRNMNQYTNRDNSENYSINQSIGKQTKKEKIINKENLSKNDENFHNINTNIKKFDSNSNSKQNKNTIMSYKTKSQNKNKSKGYQTSRNKYDNKNMYINVSTNNAKTNISNNNNNHQSLDVEINNFIKKRKMNPIHNKHIKLKNNLINVLLGSGRNSQRKKINKYKDMLIQNDINESIIDSIEIKENKDIIIEKNNSQSNRVISGSNLENNNNKFSNSSCTKAMSTNSYATKPKNSGNNINSMNHKKQISTSKIPTNVPENKALNNKNKKIKQLVEDTEEKYKLKEFVENYLDDFSSSKTNNNFNNTQPKSFQQDNNNFNFNSNYIEAKNKIINNKKNKNILLSIKNLQEKIENKNIKIRNGIYNYEKKISKKLSEKNLKLLDKIKTKSSPKKGCNKKTLSIHPNKSGNIQSSEHAPLSARDPYTKYQINAEMIALLNNKIQKIKKTIKKTSDKGLNSLSSIFKKNKIPSTGRKTFIPNTKKVDEFIEKKTQNVSKTRNKKNNNGLIGFTSSYSNIGINNNLVNSIINSIYQTNLLSPNKNIEYEKLIKTFQKFKKSTNSFNGSKNSNNKSNNSNKKNYIKNYSKKNSQRKKKQGRCNSIYGNNNNFENHINIEVNIKNSLGVQAKKSMNNVNFNKNKQKNQNDNLNSLNINFNNYTNNYNYNYNIDSINNINNNGNNGNISINNINYNDSITNKAKSNSQKVIKEKGPVKKEINLKGIPINGFDKLINKKYNTRNFNIPMSVTDRLKKSSNIYSSSNFNNNTNSKRYKNYK